MRAFRYTYRRLARIELDESLGESLAPSTGQIEFDPKCDRLVYTASGDPIHGGLINIPTAEDPAITGGPDSRKDGQPGMAEDRPVDFVVPVDAVRHGTYECYIELSVKAMFGLDLDGFLHQQPDTELHCLYGPLWLQKNVSFQLATADLRLLRAEAYRLDVDPQILTQIACSVVSGFIKDLGARALRAANGVMNTFKRSPGDAGDGSLDAVIERGRNIAVTILEDLGKRGSGDVTTDRRTLDNVLKLGAIGHW